MSPFPLILPSFSTRKIADSIAFLFCCCLACEYRTESAESYFSPTWVILDVTLQSLPTFQSQVASIQCKKVFFFSHFRPLQALAT